MLVFEERAKPEYPEKNLSEQSREPTKNSTHTWRRVRESNPGHIGGGEHSHHYAIPYKEKCFALYQFVIINEIAIHGKLMRYRLLSY